jgi:hypothetical protein
LNNLAPWVQVTGRLVIDAGHNDFATEIHPPEMVVTSRFEGGNAVEAFVATTGAWMGEPMSFVVNPPPRPTVTAKLKWRLKHPDGTDDNDLPKNATLTIHAIPSEKNPHHLVGMVKGWGNPIFLLSNGAVCHTNSRLVQKIVEATWEDEAAQMHAQIDDGGKPAKGAHLFYRRQDDGPNAIWQSAPVDATGKVTLSHLLPEKYSFRPGGSTYDFAGVPKVVDLHAGSNTLSFSTTKPKIIPRPPIVLQEALGTVGNLHITGGPTPAKDPLAAQALHSYTLRALTVERRPTAHYFGVANNGIGIPSSQTILVHLASLLDSSGQPIKDLASSYRKPLTGPNGSQSYPGGLPFLTGTTGAGVAGAVLHVRLLLGNPEVGYRVAVDLPNVTLDANGSAALTLEAGTHVEDLSISVEVVSNPKNAWFNPGVRTVPRTIYPAATGDDTIAAIPYKLTLAPTLASSGVVAGFLEGIKERAAEEAHFAKRAAAMAKATSGAPVVPKKSVVHPRSLTFVSQSRTSPCPLVTKSPNRSDRNEETDHDDANHWLSDRIHPHAPRMGALALFPGAAALRMQRR